MAELGPFPVDDATLLALEHALEASLAYDEDGNCGVVGAEFTVSKLLEFLSGYDPSLTSHLGFRPDGIEVVEYLGGPQYHEHDVIRALINEIKRLRN